MDQIVKELKEIKELIKNYLNIDNPNEKNSPIIELNVGGRHYTTLRSTINQYPDSMLATMLSGNYPITKDRNGRAFIDRNPDYFSEVLEYLRTGFLKNYTKIDPERQQAIINEFDYFGINPKPIEPTYSVKEFDLSKYESWAIGGYMFDLVAQKPLRMDAISFLSREAGEHKVVLYYKYGSYKQNEEIVDSWKILYDDQIYFPSKKPVKFNVSNENDEKKILEKRRYYFLLYKQLFK